MTEQWRVGRRNDHTVYRQHGDEPRGYEHADHDASLGYFRDPADARTAVEAVNALRDGMPFGLDPALVERRVHFVARALGHELDDSDPEWDADTALSELVGRAQAVAADARRPTPVPVPAAPDREALVKAFKAAECVRLPAGAAHFAEATTFGCPDGKEAERMADVAVAAMRVEVGDGLTNSDRQLRAIDAALVRRGYDGHGSIAERTVAAFDEEAEVRRDLRREVAAMRGDAEAEDEEFVVESPPADHRADAVLGTALGRAGLVPTVDAALVAADKVSNELDRYNAVVAFRPDLATNQGRYVARLAAAVGVRVDPDDPDPVGTVEKAVRAGREPEVVNGAEAAKLPVGSIISQWVDGRPYDGLARYAIDGWERSGGICHPDPVDKGDAEYVVWFRAPVSPAAPLAVGDEVTGQRAVNAPVGTTLRGLGGPLVEVAARTERGWTTNRVTPPIVDSEAYVREHLWRVLDLGPGEQADTDRGDRSE